MGAGRTPKINRKGFHKPVILGEFVLEIDGQKISYILKRSSAARLIWLRISPETGLSVTVPSSYNVKKLPEYLLSRSSWIQNNLNKMHPIRPGDAPETSTLPKEFTYLGKHFSLKHNAHSGEFTAVALDTENLNFNIRSSFSEASRQGIKAWLKTQAAHLIEEKVNIYAGKMQLFPNRIYIKDQKSLWGSCSARKNLSFNWRLIMVPESVMEYVVIHELCHLKEMNHSKIFWKLVDEYCHDWRIHRKWLKEHCYELKAQLS
jgi:predicted metal-dependent hydrolase